MTVPELVNIRLLFESNAKKLDVVADANCTPCIFMGFELADMSKVPDTDSVCVGNAVPIPILPPFGARYKLPSDVDLKSTYLAGDAVWVSLNCAADESTTSNFMSAAARPIATLLVVPLTTSVVESTVSPDKLPTEVILVCLDPFKL